MSSIWFFFIIVVSFFGSWFPCFFLVAIVCVVLSESCLEESIQEYTGLIPEF